MVTLKLKAYLSPYASIKAHEVSVATAEQLERNCYVTAHEPGADYTLIGDVEAKLHLHGHSDIVGNKVTALREMQRVMRVRAQEEDTRLEGEIQSLLSITMSPGMSTNPKKEV